MKYQIVSTSRFKKDAHLAKKQGRDLKKLVRVINLLAEGARLPKENKDHFLTENFNGYRECHIESDWLLVYKIDGDLCILTLSRTGTHSVLFGK